MTGWISRLSLPLFTKELQELAARRRTYVIRVTYVALLSYFAMATLAHTLQNSNPLNALGQGLPVLTALVYWEFTGIYLFLPAMACGVFTTEKERNTLALLFLTRLGPWTLIIEKLLSRLFPMFMFLCSALPVMAFTYSMGGLTAYQLFCSAWFLFLAAFQIACIAVMCSTLNYSTATAFVQTYFVLFLMTITLPFAGSIFPQLLRTLWELLLLELTGRSGPQGVWGFGLSPQVLLQVLSPATLFQEFMNPWRFMNSGVGVGTASSPWLPVILLGFPSFLSGIGCLFVARWALYRRAFVAPSNPLLRFFRGIDKIFFWANRNVAFDVKLVREADTLPGDEPIAWREVSKRSLGQFRYLVRIMIPLLFPVIFIGMFLATSSASDWQNTGPGASLSPLVLFVGSVTLVLIGVTAANTVPLERTRQTWDVLRSMPLTGREILTQKLRGVRRLQWVCSIPVICAMGLEAWWRYQLHVTGLTHRMPGTRFADEHFLWWEYLIGAVLSLCLYSELVKWIAFWCGLMVRNSIRAILATGACVVLYTGLPSLILVLAVNRIFVNMPEFFDNDLMISIMQMTELTWPGYFIAQNEFGDLREGAVRPLAPALINLSFQGALLFLLRRHILKRAEWYVGRMGTASRWTSARPTVRETSTHLEDAATPEVAGAL